jgi:chemotaxis protein MotB
MDQARFTVSGLAATHALVPNDTPDNRSLNRRVEIVIQKGKDEEALLPLQSRPDGDTEGQSLRPSEIF